MPWKACSAMEERLRFVARLLEGEAMTDVCPWLELIWADGGYNAHQVDAAVAKISVLRVEIVKRTDDMKGLVVLPRRWVVERSFSWFGRNRRLAKDFENLAETILALVTIASIQLALRQLART